MGDICARGLPWRGFINEPADYLRAMSVAVSTATNYIADRNESSAPQACAVSAVCQVLAAVQAATTCLLEVAWRL